MKKSITILSVANEFSRLIQRDYTTAELALVNERNARPDYKDACATHDFYDSNEIFAEAFKNIVGRELNAVDEQDTHLSNEAWGMAKANKFEVKGEVEVEAIINFNEDSCIEEHYTEHTGGNLYVDIIKLKTGKVLSINEEMICVWDNIEQWEEGGADQKHVELL